MARKYENEILERLACDIANWWLRQRQDPRVTDRMDPGFARKLDELEGLTRGDDRRCHCLTSRDSLGARHDVQCPAFRPG
jgi:hypothetical protein